MTQAGSTGVISARHLSGTPVEALTFGETAARCQGTTMQVGKRRSAVTDCIENDLGRGGNDARR